MAMACRIIASIAARFGLLMMEASSDPLMISPALACAGSGRMTPGSTGDWIAAGGGTLGGGAVPSARDTLVWAPARYTPTAGTPGTRGSCAGAGGGTRRAMARTPTTAFTKTASGAKNLHLAGLMLQQQENRQS